MRDNVGKLWYSVTIKTHEMWLIVLFAKLVLEASHLSADIHMYIQLF